MMIWKCVLIIFLVGTSFLAQADEVPSYHIIQRIERVNVRPALNLVEYFAFNPSASQIVAAASAEAVNIWDVETGAVIHSLDFASTAVSWSPDGRLIAASRETDSIIHVWDAESTMLEYVLEGHPGRHSAWHPESRYLATSGMKVFNAVTGEIHTALGSNWGIPYAVYWSPDGMLLATSSGWEGAHLNIWSIEGERLDTYWAGTSAAWSPNSSRLASRGQVRDMTTGLPLVIIPEMYDQITWHPNGVWLASVADDQVFLWDAETGAAITTWPFEGCSINGFSWSANGSRFALGCIHGEDQSQNDLIIAEVIP